ncbi:MAG: dihydrolipoamide acetyltransferase family protein [Mucilaginibacter sp.]
MAKYQLLLPKMGESVAEATIIKWTKKPGDRIEADESVVEIATDKVDSEVPSPVSGTLIEYLVAEEDIVEVGKAIAIIETDEQPVEEVAVAEEVAAETAPEEVKPEEPEVKEEAPALAEETPVEEASAEETPVTVEETPEVTVETVPAATQEIPVEEPAEATPAPEPVPFTEQLQEKPAPAETFKASSASRFYSPLVRSIASTEGVSNDELDLITGSGAEGRLTKDDLINYIRGIRSGEILPFNVGQRAVEDAQAMSEASHAVTEYPQPGTEAPVQVSALAPKGEQPTAAAPVQPAYKPEFKTTSVSGGDEIIEMDRMRKLIAEHMVKSVQTSPHVTSFVEADVTNLVLWREKIKNTFEKREGEKITFTPIFIEAVVKAIKDFPMINVSVNGTQIIKKKDINISMATALPSGNLIVPVIKQADNLSLLGITKAVNDLANRARNNKLLPADVQDGTFTITNVGSFGNVMGTPIINQPQVAILAVGAIKKKPAVIETPEGDAIGIRHMMFLSLSYDHRVVDGALGGSFARRVADYLENWDVNRVV